jgi:hypothetical protein
MPVSFIYRLHHTRLFLGIFFDPEDKGEMFSETLQYTFISIAFEFVNVAFNYLLISSMKFKAC